MSTSTGRTVGVSAWARRLGEAGQRLPREARDTLLLLTVIGLTIMPHLLHLPPWCALMTLAVLAWRARQAATAGPLPRRWVISLLLVVAVALTAWGERTLLGRDAGVTLLVVLMTLKTLEMRARRDALVTFFLGFFLVLTHFLYSQTLLTGVWMLVSLWGLLTALVLAHMPVGRPPILRAAAIAARATALGVPLMLLLFVLFPRVGPLWGLPQDAAGRTGLSGSLRMGAMAEVAEDNSVALRVRFFGATPRPEQQYFRGPVLSSFDGLQWTRLTPTVPAAQRPRSELRVRGEGLPYEVTIEPNRLPLLPMLEATPDDERAAPQQPGWMFTLRPDLQWQADRPVDQRLRVRALAYPDFQHGPLDAVSGLADLVRLPADQNPRTVAWARELVLRPDLLGADPTRLAQAVLEHIRTGDYSYTLEPGTYGNGVRGARDAVDEFWFDRKLGFCEHFSVAFVVVMRSMGVPARIVTGYQGMDPVPQDGYWIVRQRNAHAWAEYWQAGRGWVRADPTAAVAPERVQRGLSLRPQPGLMAQALGSIDPTLVVRLRDGWETLNNRWNQWVLNYSRNQQFDLLKELGMDAPDWQDLATLLVGALCLLALVGAAWAWWDRHRQDPWLRLQQRVQQRLARLGVQVAPHDPPLARATRVRETLGPRGERLAGELDALAAVRYGAGRPAGHRAWNAWWRRFQTAARALRTA